MNPIQDTISLQLRADTVVVSDTVRVTVLIDALSTSTTSDSELRLEIKHALDKLIPNADWSFGGLSRSRDSSGFERVTLKAVTRVNEKENVKLNDRAEQASKEGLSLKNVEVDLTVPAPLIEAAEKKLRATLIEKALEELDIYAQITGRAYRLSNISFNQNLHNALKYATNSSYTVLNDDGDDGISNSQKVTLNADVTFSVLVPTATEIDDTVSVRMKHRIVYGMGPDMIAENERLWSEENPNRYIAQYQSPSHYPKES